MNDQLFTGRDCIHFDGYKPCFPGEDCTEVCQHPTPFGTRILIINLDAMGDVLMTTAQLPGIKRQFPQSAITWITLRNAVPLLENNPYLYRVIEWNDENRMILQREEFDLVLDADKSKASCAFVETLRASEIRGFRLNRFGQIVPAQNEAWYNYTLGLNDHLKFRMNQKTGQEILAESWSIPYQRDEYTLVLTDEEQQFCARKKVEWYLEDDRPVVGFNTGCSHLYPNKKMTVEQHIRLIEALAAVDGLRILLLGGKEDAERNARIFNAAKHLGERVIKTPTTEGVRRGLCYVNLADAVITGDSFGMHAAIALRKQVLVWFGVSCWAEIDLYDRGKKFFPEDLFCSPCWKKKCPYHLECISMIDLPGIESEVRRIFF